MQAPVFLLEREVRSLGMRRRKEDMKGGEQVSILSDLSVIHITVRNGVVVHVCIFLKENKWRPTFLEPEFHYKVDYEPDREEES